MVNLAFNELKPPREEKESEYVQRRLITFCPMNTRHISGVVESVRLRSFRICLNLIRDVFICSESARSSKNATLLILIELKNVKVLKDKIAKLRLVSYNWINQLKAL